MMQHRSTGHAQKNKKKFSSLCDSQVVGPNLDSDIAKRQKTKFSISKILKLWKVFLIRLN